MEVETGQDSQAFDKAQLKLNEVLEETSKVIVGQDEVMERPLTAVLAHGNILVESKPGLGKTKMIRTLSRVLGLDFSRIQNTPDLMPSDVTGTHVIDESGGSKEFVFQKGPIFANMVLADEINRATPKTQSALLEAMQEQQVTVGDSSYSLEDPFFMMATQNPIDQEGTFPLPEAQKDRFLMKVKVDYPNTKEEVEIVDRFSSEVDYSPELEQVLSKSSLVRLQNFTRKVPIADDIRRLAIEMVRRTRKHENLEFGASPRASLAIVNSAKARALIEGRNYVSEDDIKNLAVPVLRHRVGLSFQAEKEGKTEEEVIQNIKSSL